MAINSISQSPGSKPLNVTGSQKITSVENKPQSGVNPSNTYVPTDQVSLTGTASQLRSLEQQLANQPIVDVQRVDALKREISNGSFDINPPKIADKMIQIETAINKGLT